MLADYRTGNKAPHWGDELTLLDMAQIWGAWRSGIYGVTCFRGPSQCGFRDLDQFQKKIDLGPQAKLGYPYFAFFSRYFNRVAI
jgi:hypothetical protein